MSSDWSVSFIEKETSLSSREAEEPDLVFFAKEKLDLVSTLPKDHFRTPL